MGLPQMKWKPGRLDRYYNESLPAAPIHSFWTSDNDYPYAPCRDYLFLHLVRVRIGQRNDCLLRFRINSQGTFTTRAGIPFAERALGSNLVAGSRWKEFPYQKLKRID